MDLTSDTPLCQEETDHQGRGARRRCAHHESTAKRVAVPKSAPPRAAPQACGSKPHSLRENTARARAFGASPQPYPQLHSRALLNELAVVGGHSDSERGARSVPNLIVISHANFAATGTEHRAPTACVSAADSAMDCGISLRLNKVTSAVAIFDLRARLQQRIKLNDYSERACNRGGITRLVRTLFGSIVVLLPPLSFGITERAI